MMKSVVNYLTKYTIISLFFFFFEGCLFNRVHKLLQQPQGTIRCGDFRQATARGVAGCKGA